MTRASLVVAAVVVALAAGLAPAPARAQDDATEEVYLTRDQALREIFDDGERIESATVRLTDAERARIEARLGMRLFERAFEFFRGLDESGAVVGYAVVTEEIGKYKPITFIVGVTPGAKVIDVAVMVYRESHGSDVKRRRFLAQFRGKTKDDPIKQNRDIVNISGATLSVRSIARGVRKVLFAVDEILLGPARRTSLEWRSVALAGEGGGEGAGEGDEAAGAKRESSAAAPVRRARYLMGTILEATAFGDDPRAVAAALAAAFDEVARIEALLTTFCAESEISRVNREAARAPVPVSADTLACVREALEVAYRSGGAFDPTLQPGGWRGVVLDKRARTICFAREGLRLDLGGIGKGYALDRAAAVLRERGVARAALDFGGQVLALDPPPGEAGWLVAVRDPADPDGAIGAFEVARASVSTSGQQERPEHIRDPRTGAPSAASAQATLVCPSAARADALSTAAFVLGPEAGARLVAGERGAAAVLVAPGGGAAPIVVRTEGAPEFRAVAP